MIVTSTAPATIVAPTERGTRILYVEDDPGFRFSLASGLAEFGFDVRCAADGLEALRVFDQEGADLVVLDLGLPGMDGLAVCRALKARRESFLPVLFLTAQSDVETVVELLEEGGDDFCPKPFRLPELVARLKTLLRTLERERRLEQLARGFRDASLADALTGLGNRRAFDEALAREWARAGRSGEALALLLCDVDRFKQVNDTHGHAAGDQVLVAVSRAIQSSVRQGDQLFRFGGEEIAVLAPATSAADALHIGERIRRAVASLTLPTGAITISIGVGVGPTPQRVTTADLFRIVDQALYGAKATGRNRVVAASAPRS